MVELCSDVSAERPMREQRGEVSVCSDVHDARPATTAAAAVSLRPSIWLTNSVSSAPQ